MLKRIVLFFAMNIAVIVVISGVFTILEHVFGWQLDLYGVNYVSIALYSAIVGFSGAFISLFLSKWMAKMSYHIELIEKAELFHLSDKEKIVWETVEKIADKYHIEMPEVGIYQDNEPNAFATGATKNSALVAVSSGLLEIMDEGAIEGVIAHEMAHILNGDMVTMTLLQGVLNTFVVFFARIVSNLFNEYTDGKFGALGYMLVNILLQIVFGIFASLIAMKFSRYREFRADAGSASFVGKEKMIAGLQALKKMQASIGGEKDNLAMMKISSKKSSGIMKMFSSHPDLDERIQALERI